MWSILIVTLPSRPNAIRVRIWRGLKALGCVALRDGAYLLPLAEAARFESLAVEVREHGGTASVMRLAPRDEAQKAEVLAQFDRSADYAQWHESATVLAREVDKLAETDARRRLRTIADALQSLRGIDYYPGAAATQAEADLIVLRRTLESRFSSGEPHARGGHEIARLDPAKYQGKRWATRSRPWVDRLACAWLIRRFIDRGAEFVWLPDVDGMRAPKGVLGFDYDGARFTHVGSRVTFEVMATAFGLHADARLQRISRIVHYLDVGGIPVAEATGLESVLSGLRELHAGDDELAAAAMTVFDALHAAPGEAR